MKTPRQEIEFLVAQMAQKLFGTDLPPAPYVRPCLDARHGDFQTNLALVLGKKAGVNPREIAVKIAEAAKTSALIEEPEIAGPCFVNFRLKPAYCAEQIQRRVTAPQLGFEPVSPAKTVIVEYSSPTPIKEMHVGHLRSTIIGDALARLYRFIGHHVITDNHLGDWGTGWGMVLYGHHQYGSEEELKKNPLPYIEQLYIRVNKESEENPAVRESARAEILKLQQGDPAHTELWKHFMEAVKIGLQELYDKLGIRFDYILTESFYNPMLQPLVDDFLVKGIAKKSEGATVVFFEEDPKLKEHPCLIQKSDGGFLYATTDLATVKYRVEHFKSDLIIVLSDGRQQMHFQQIIAASKKWLYPDLKMENVWFGTVQGEDKKPLKGRSGAPIKFKSLLEEAETRAVEIIKAKRPEMEESAQQKLASVVGIGALKYADLAQNRNLDYVFNWDKLLAFDGNTAPYLLNAYVRIRAIFRKAGLTGNETPAAVQLAEPAELTLAKKLLDFGDAVVMAAEEFRPHYLCVYLFELATMFHQFYENCPVLNSEASVRASRLALCALTAETLKTGLNLLGIETVEQM